MFSGWSRLSRAPTTMKGTVGHSRLRVPTAKRKVMILSICSLDDVLVCVNFEIN